MGESDCAPDPARCTAQPYAGELPADTLYVAAAAAPGGDGSAAAPLVSLTAALAAAKADQTIAVDSGTYVGPFSSKVPVQIRGRCAAQVLLTSTDTIKPVWSWTSGNLELADVRVTGEARGLAASGGVVNLTRVMIDGARTIGLHATNGAAVIGGRMVIRNTAADSDGKGGRGVWAESGAWLDLMDSALLGNRTAGLTLSGAASEGHLLQVSVIGTLPQPADNKGGRGVVVSDGAALEAEALQVHNNRTGGVALYNAGAVQLDFAAIAGTKSEASGGAEGYGLLVAGGTVTGSALHLQGNQAAGIYATGPNSSLYFDQAYVRSTQPNASGLGVGLRVEAGAKVAIHALDSSQNTAYGVLASGPSTSLSLDNSLIADTAPNPTDSREGYGIWCQDGASCSLAKTRLHQNRTVAATAAGAGTSLTCTDSIISATLSRLEDLGRGVGLQIVEGASCEASGLLIHGSRAAGLWVSDPGPVTLDGLQIAATQAQEKDGWGGRGIHWVRTTGTAATGDIRNAVLQNNRDHQLYLEGDTLILDQVAIAQTESDAAGDGGHAMQLRKGAQLTGTHMVLTDHRTVAVLARDPGTSATLTDGCILRTLPRAADGAYGRAAVAEAGAALTLSRMRLSAHRGVTVSAASVAGADDSAVSKLVLQDVVVDGTLPGASEGDQTARGVEVHHSRLSVEGLRVHNAAGAAMGVYGDADAKEDSVLRDIHITHDAAASTKAVGLVADDAGGLVVRRLRSAGPLAVHVEMRGNTQLQGGHWGLHHGGEASKGIGLFCAEQAVCDLRVSRLTGAWLAGVLGADAGTQVRLTGTAVGEPDAAARARFGAVVSESAVLEATASVWQGADSAAVVADAAGSDLADCALYQSAAKAAGADGLRLSAGASGQFRRGQIAGFGRCGALAGSESTLLLANTLLTDNRFGIGQMLDAVYTVVASWLTGNQNQLGVGAFVLPVLPQRPVATERAPAFTL